MANHLIIGLGGTGGGVLRELRKRVYTEFKADEPADGSVRLEYIYVDSSPADLDGKTGWKVMNHSVHLKEAQKVSINGININMFNNLNMYPGLRCFLTDNDVELMKTKMQGLISDGIGGQRRRLGRTLFANNLSVSGANSDFNSRLKQTVNRLANNDASVTFHVCAGLAGGTGSGSIVDVVSQIRKEYTDENMYRLYLYLYVPEINVINQGFDSGFYQANGYAALQELNAMSVGVYHPYDVTGQKDNYTGEVQRLLQGVKAFDAAFLYTNINEAGKVLDIKSTLPVAVSDFLFQKIVAAGLVNDGQMKRLEKCENDGADPESDQSGNPCRSRKFMSFGIKRIEYPETEIEEFVTYNFARQAARQLEFNKWQEGIGYGECSLDEVGAGFMDEIKDRKRRDALLLSNNHLTLSKPIIETSASKRWKDIENTWEERTQEFADDVQTGTDKKSWLANFSKDCEDYYNLNYRTHGVKKFYEIQRDERMSYAKYIRRHIEGLLFKEWGSGVKSILEIEKYVRLLIEDCTDRIHSFREQIGKQQEELDAVNSEIHDCNVEWDNIGWLRDAITGASKKVLSRYKTAKCDYYTISTRIEGYNYAILLLQDIINQLGISLEGVLMFKTQLSEILEEVNKQAGARCRNEANLDENMTLKKYNPEKIQEFSKVYSADQKLQVANALAIRNKMIAMLPVDEEHSFTDLCDKLDYSSTTDLIMEICLTNSKNAMRDTAQNDPLNKMIGVNILEKLRQEYNTPEKLEKFVRDMVQSALTYLPLDQEEQAKNFGGNMMPPMIQLCIPNLENDKSGFRNDLIDMFVHVYPGFDPKQDVANNYRDNQVVVVAAKSGFPLRYISNLKTLKKKYEDKLSAPDKDLNKMALHTESFEKPLPSLYELDNREREKIINGFILMAYGLGLFSTEQDPSTGERFEAYVVVDDFGDYEPKKVGKDFFGVIKALCDDWTLAMTIKKMVESKVKTECRSNDQKQAMKKKLIDVVKEKVLASAQCENNQFNPIYIKYKDLAKVHLNNELKEL